MLGVRDLFRVGIGPSSSHTVGPMKAAHSFAQDLVGLSFVRVQCDLLGSLAWTGVGHVTDKAVVLGLAGFLPDTIDPRQIDTVVATARDAKTLRIAGRDITFDPDADIFFDRQSDTPVHPNTLRLRALDAGGGEVLVQRWCSIGGGFIVPEDKVGEATPEDEAQPPFPFRTGQELLDICDRRGLTIAEVMRANELARTSAEDLDAYLDRVIDVMMACIDRGMHTDGILPGRLKVPRRAMKLRQKLEGDRFRNRQAPHSIMDHISLFAIAVNEENAAGGKVVTAPTNGAAGVIPAVLRYYRDFWPEANRAGMRDFLLVASAIGVLTKLNASISGAEVGCQGEVGTASAMAAAGMAMVMGATNHQVENAAEIAMEHHLGMTCDPIAGLVQVPCIERNAFGAVKAINAASLSLRGDGQHIVSLDQVIETMMRTGRDMHTKYKETSQGGLAVSFPEC